MNLEEIQTGDIILSSSKSIIARIIQIFQKMKNKEAGKYNHAMIAFKDKNNNLFVVEAEKRGIQKTDFIVDYVNKNKYVEIIGFHPNFKIDEDKIIEFMQLYINKTKYDYIDLIIYQPIKLLSFGKIWLGEKKEDGKKFICSEWVSFVYNNIMDKKIFDKQTSMSPSDFFEYKEYFKKYPIKP